MSALHPWQSWDFLSATTLKRAGRARVSPQVGDVLGGSTVRVCVFPPWFPQRGIKLGACVPPQPGRPSVRRAFGLWALPNTRGRYVCGLAKKW